eukprot:331144_1
MLSVGKKKKKFQWQIPAAMGLNFSSAVGIIFVNKIIFKQYDFQYATFLTGCHFVMTFFGLIILSLKPMSYFTVRSVNIREVIPICLAFCGFVIFNNLSLQTNSVGFYQLMKVMTTPVVGIIQYTLYSVTMNIKLIVSLIFVVIGIIIVTCNEVELRFWGLIYAICGILSTSFYQVWVKTRQQDLGLSPPQLLYYQAPISAIMVFMVTPLLDPIFTPMNGDVFEVSNPNKRIIGLIDYNFYNSKILYFIFLSCILAFLVNLSIFLTIGKTSPITYNVLGHFKLCVVTIGGTFLFNEDTNPRKIAGVTVALFGITMYTYWKLQTSNAWDKRAKKIVQKHGIENGKEIENGVSVHLLDKKTTQ